MSYHPVIGNVNNNVHIRLYLPWHVESLLSQVWFPRHVLVTDPDRSKLLSQENVATTPTPYSPLAKEAW